MEKEATIGFAWSSVSTNQPPGARANAGKLLTAKPRE